MKIICIGWPLNPMIGWGIYGINLTLQLLKNHGYQALLMMPPSLESGILNPLHQALLTSVFEAQKILQNQLQIISYFRFPIPSNLFPVACSLKSKFMHLI